MRFKEVWRNPKFGPTLVPILMAIAVAAASLAYAAAPPTTLVGTPTLATGQVTVATSAISVCPLRNGRQSCTIVQGSTVDTFCGASNAVTISTGILLTGTKGASLKFDTGAQIFCINGTTTTVSFAEVY